MSKSKLLSLAVAAALMAPTAFATTLTSTVTVLPRNAFVDATVTASNVNAVTILADATSVYLGRTTGYNVRLTLGAGVFNGNPAATLEGGTVSATLAGGGDNSTVATFSVTPNAAGVLEDDGISFAAGAIDVDGLAALGTAGTVGITVQVFDPVGGNQLGSTLTGTLFQTVEGWQISYAAPADAVFGANQRIDVGADSGKKEFSSNGVVNASADNVTFAAGSITVGLNPDLDAVMGLDAAVATVDLTVSGDNFAPFDDAANGPSLFLTALDDCSGAHIATFTNAVDNLSANVTGSTVSAVSGATICFEADGVTTIAAQSLGGSAFVEQASMLDSPATAEDDEFLDMAFNGIVKTITSFNPNSNTAVDSLLRVVNTSSTSGLFTVDASCPDGTDLTSATFTLGGDNAAVQYSSNELQTGTAGAGKPALSAAMGTCSATGRLRMTVTGEVGTAEVQNFLRANTSAGVITSGNNNEN